MNFKEMNLRIFEGKKIPHVLFQPRIEPWYHWHKHFNMLPEKYKNMSILELFDDLKISMRYFDYYTNIPHPIETVYTDKIKIKENFEKEYGKRIIETPYGDLIEVLKKTPDDTWRTIDFPVKTKDDLKKLRYLYENTIYHFSIEKFETGVKFIGERGMPQFWLQKSPYQAFRRWMHLEDFIYALCDNPVSIEEVIEAMDTSYNKFYDEIISYGKVKIVNFGENIHAHTLSPKYFEKYLIPYYMKRSNQLRKSGIYTHIHIDGYFKPLLKFLKDLPFDGLEALTPLPQGDVTIEEIKEYIGDKILIDGIPAVLFLPTYSRDELQKCVEKLVKLFHPKLILGISDEIPENADEEGIERVRWVSQYCQKYLTV
ncbi:MAG: uroporphyrinogen decarboxylase family protein [Candidatus Firestonebacteria bacterium]